MGYAYDKDGKTYVYKMGTSNAGLLLKGAKKVPKGTLFFIGQNGQLYMRTGPYLDGDGKFMFGSNWTCYFFTSPRWGEVDIRTIVRMSGEGHLPLQSESRTPSPDRTLSQRERGRNFVAAIADLIKTPKRVPWRPAGCCWSPSGCR